MSELPSSSQAPQAPAKPGTSKATRLLLAGSLAVNLAIAGFVIGHALDGDGPGRHRGMPVEMAFGPFTEALSDDDRSALRDALISRAPDMRDARNRMSEDLGNLVTALRAEPFDPAAVDAAFAAQNRRMTANLDLAQAVLRDFLVALSPEARLAFAARLAERIGLRGDGS